MNLIGISGTNGSGKDTLGEILEKNYNFLFISVTDILRDELRRQGLPLSRKNSRELSAKWRRESGLGVLIDKALKIYEKQADKYRGLAIASLRNPGEADRVHELGGKVIWLDALPKIRFDRVQTNRSARGALRSVDDNVTFVQFIAAEEVEMHHSGDEATLNMSAVRQKADIFINNNSKAVESFMKKIEKSLFS
jgi:cytidylate kinase